MPVPLTAELQRILERKRAHGVRNVSLSPSVSQAFFERSPASPTAAPANRPVRPQPAARPMPSPVAVPVAKPSSGPPRAAPAPAPVPAVADLPPVGGLPWEDLQACVATCRLCQLCTGRTNTVFGDGDPDARLMFIGEGPGYDEDQQGIPFVGKAGQLLTKMIQAMQFARSEVYIANIVKCRPPGNRNPEPEEVAACLPYLHRQIELIKPAVIVLLGAVPLRSLIGGRSIRRERGEWREYQGIPVMPTFHPSYLLRLPQAKRDVWNDLQQVMQRLGKAPQPPRQQ